MKAWQDAVLTSMFYKTYEAAPTSPPSFWGGAQIVNPAGRTGISMLQLH
ncbi:MULTISPECIES: hypothetical protein [unclassified Mesorhizobium]|nr:MULTISPECIES: hypothetical protein [unclassified Mesorhizobium]